VQSRGRELQRGERGDETSCVERGERGWRDSRGRHVEGEACRM